MANRFTVRRGASTPTSSNLLAYELGYNTTNDTLYIGREGKNPYQLNYDILPVEKGGTGVKTLEELSTKLNVEPSFEVLSIEKGGTNAKTAEQARKNLGAEPSFDVLSIEKGGTGNETGNAISATKLETARNLSVDLANGGFVSFDGTADKQLGVFGILPIANGGTGKGTRTEAIENLVSGGYITDANIALSVGTYSTNDQTTNLPFQTYGTLFTYKPDQNWIVQIWTSTNSAETCLYMRKNTNSDGFGSWFKVFGEDNVITVAQGGTGANNASDALTNLGGTTKIGAYQFLQLPSGTDLSSLALSEGLYWYEGVATTEKGFPYADESPRWLIEIKGFYWNASAGNGYRVITLYDFGRDKIWIRRNWWGGWGEWKSIYDTHNIDIQVGTLAVSTGGTTLTFPRPFAGTPVVTANSSNQTSVKVENVSATSVKLTAGTSGSTVQWQAIYIPS